MQIKLTIRQMLHLLTTGNNADFILFNVKDDMIINYKLTSDLIRYKNKYNHFKVLSCIKDEIINNNSINI